MKLIIPLVVLVAGLRTWLVRAERYWMSCDADERVPGGSLVHDAFGFSGGFGRGAGTAWLGSAALGRFLGQGRDRGVRK